MAALTLLKAQHTELTATLLNTEHVPSASAATVDREDSAARLRLPNPDLGLEGTDQPGSGARPAGEDAEGEPCGGPAGSKGQRRWGSESSGGGSLLSGVGSAMAEWRQQAAGRMSQAEMSGSRETAGGGRSSKSMPIRVTGSVVDDGRQGEVDNRWAQACLLDGDPGADEGGGGVGSGAFSGAEGVKTRLRANLKEQVAAITRCVQAVHLSWSAEQRTRTALLFYPRSLGVPDFIAVMAAADGGSGPVALPDAEHGPDL